MQKQIADALEEKKVLLQEIHHRVKNNLAVIISLLKLQSLNIEDEGIIAIFQDSEHRIRAMSLVHEMLYKTKDLSHIDFGSYIETLTQTMLRTYIVSPAIVKVKIDIKDIQLNTDSSITIGLVINELVSNAMKHAFPGGRSGEMSITMKKIDSENNYEILIKDNGVGMPEGIDIRNTDTLGLKMVTNMVERQLSGSIEMKSEGGTEYKIRFQELVRSNKMKGTA